MFFFILFLSPFLNSVFKRQIISIQLKTTYIKINSSGNCDSSFPHKKPAFKHLFVSFQKPNIC